MKRFKGVRPLQLIEKNLKLYGFVEDDRLYKSGSDFITFMCGNLEGKLIYCLLVDPVFGRFVVSDPKAQAIASERSESFDGEPWYDALLDCLYIQKEE